MSAPPLSIDSRGQTTGSVARGSRVIGLDVARGLAVFGMFAAHVGPDVDAPVIGPLMTLAHGRSSILFAVLAGISIALMTQDRGTEGQPSRRERTLRIAIRGALLLSLGTLLTVAGTPVEVILAYYGLLFLLVLPFLWAKPRTLLTTAAVLVVVAPLLSFAIRSWQVTATFLDRIDQVDPITSLQGEGLVQLLLTGNYPAVTWLPFILTGLAVGRIGVRRIGSPTLMLLGSVFAIFGYGGGWIAERVVQLAGGREDYEFGPPSGDLTQLLNAEEHSGTPFEILGGIGTALLAIGTCLWLARRYPRAVRPVAVVGAMSLTVYTLHVLAINVFGLSALPGEPLPVLTAFIAGAIVFATLWSRWFRRGPLEAFMHRVTVRNFSR